MKKCGSFKIILITFLVLGSSYFCFVKASGFTVGKVYSDLSFNHDWEPSTPLSLQEHAEIKKILDQPFFYLGKGVQCYAFISQDQKTVLKLFKHYHMWPDNGFLKKFRLPGFLDSLRTNTIEDRERRATHVYDSCHIAYDDYRKETGLIAIHLNKTPLFHKQLHLYDKLGICHKLDLDAVPFLLQKKAELVFPKFLSFKHKQDVVGAKRSIDALLNLIVARCQKGIANQDAMIIRNFGYLGDEAVEIDVGSFKKDRFLKSSHCYKKELFYEIKQLKTWIKKEYPEILPYLNEKILTLLNNDEAIL